MAERQLVLVDTSVFIHFFRGKDVPEFESLVEENRAVLSQFVRLELMMGVRKSELNAVASALSGLIQSVHHPEICSVAEDILSKLRPKGITIGTIDLLLAAEANINGHAIISYDKVFNKMASMGLIRTI